MWIRTFFILLILKLIQTFLAGSVKSAMTKLSNSIHKYWISNDSGHHGNRSNISCDTTSSSSTESRSNEGLASSNTRRRSTRNKSKNALFTESDEIHIINDTYNMDIQQGTGIIKDKYEEDIKQGTGSRFYYKEGWSNCLCSALMFLPLLLYGKG